MCVGGGGWPSRQGGESWLLCFGCVLIFWYVPLFVCVLMYIPHGQDLDKFICFDSLRPSQQFFSHVGTCLAGSNQY